MRASLSWHLAGTGLYDGGIRSGPSTREDVRGVTGVERSFIGISPVYAGMARIKRALSRARYAAIGGAVGGALGGLFSRNAASTGAAIGGLLGATYGEKRLDVGAVVARVKERGEEVTA